MTSSLKTDELFLEVLEDPQGLAFLVTYALVKERRFDEDQNLKYNVDLNFDEIFCPEDEEFYDRVTNRLGRSYDSLDTLLMTTNGMDPEELIKIAFELGYIEQAFKCQEALRRARTHQS